MFCVCVSVWEQQRNSSTMEECEIRHRQAPAPHYCTPSTEVPSWPTGMQGMKQWAWLPSHLYHHVVSFLEIRDVVRRKWWRGEKKAGVKRKPDARHGDKREIIILLFLHLKSLLCERRTRSLAPFYFARAWVSHPLYFWSRTKTSSRRETSGHTLPPLGSAVLAPARVTSNTVPQAGNVLA